MFLWQQVSSTEIAQRLRERAATYTGSASEGLPDAAFDRETICKPSQNRGDISK